MKTQIHVLVALATCSGLLLPVFSAGLLESSATIHSSGVVQQTSTGTYSYIINVSGSNYQMTDGTTGQIAFQSTNSGQVFSNVVGNCSVGSSIYVERGIYTVNTTWTMINVNNITLNFENEATLVAANNLNAPVLYLDGARNCVISGITINGNAANQESKAGGINPQYYECGIWIYRGANNHVDGANITKCGEFGFVTGGVSNGITNSLLTFCGWNGITLGDITVTSIGNYAINNQVAYCGDVGITNYGSLNIVQNNYIHDMNGTKGSINSQWGIGIEGGSNDLISGNTINNVNVGISLTNSGITACGPANNNTISGNVITNTAGGISLQSSYNIVRNNQITNVSAGKSGIWLNNAAFNTLSDNYVSYCDHTGIMLASTSINNTLSLNNVFDNTVIGIDVFSNDNYISQNQVYSDGGSPQWIGILMEANSANNVLTGNNLYGNTNSQIKDINIPENALINNIGYNPVGYIPSPISGNTAYLIDLIAYGTSGNSTWISGKVYTNSGSPKILNISGGTVSVVTQNGVTLFTATGCTVTLQPGDTFSVTFSTAPTINVFGQ